MNLWILLIAYLIISSVILYVLHVIFERINSTLKLEPIQPILATAHVPDPEIIKISALLSEVKLQLDQPNIPLIDPGFAPAIHQSNIAVQAKLSEIDTRIQSIAISGRTAWGTSVTKINEHSFKPKPEFKGIVK